MVSTPNVGYQPAVAFQGGNTRTVQQPKTNNTQPRHAPAADTQSSNSNRGTKLNIKV